MIGVTDEPYITVRRSWPNTDAAGYVAHINTDNGTSIRGTGVCGRTEADALANLEKLYPDEVARIERRTSLRFNPTLGEIATFAFVCFSMLVLCAASAMYGGGK